MEKSINQSISLLSHIHSVTSDFLRDKLKENGWPDFATSHGNILFQLKENQNMTMKDLSEKINRDKSTTTVLVRKLEQEGLIETVSDTNDKRSKLIRLTKKGKEYNCKTSEISKDLIATFYKDFNQEEKEKFVEFLQRISNNFS
ncbi:MAG: MarR family transcriptional regulator [Treponema sp.]|nr:MarR family transcriptional regulator [Treponema sp.]